MDKLEKIFELQQKLNEDIRAKRNLSGITNEEWIQKQMLALLDELGEVLGEINWKWWKNPKPVDKAKLQEELVDVLHFFISMCIEADMSAQDMYDIYLAKNKENFDRQLGLSAKEGYKAD